MSIKTEWQMVCPKCGSDKNIAVKASIWAQLTVNEYGERDVKLEDSQKWHGNSVCACRECGFKGVVRDFRNAFTVMG